MLDKLVPGCARLVEAAVAHGELHPGVTAYVLMRAVGNLCILGPGYEDRPTGVMVEEGSGAGQFESVTLHPTVTITAASDPALAHDLHDRVGDYCFIARSVSTPIHHEVVVRVDPDS
jgi:hypothetical protein